MRLSVLLIKHVHVSMSNSRGILFQMCAAHNPCRMSKWGLRGRTLNTLCLIQRKVKAAGRLHTHPPPLLSFHQSLLSFHTTQDKRGLDSCILPFTLSAELLACHSRSQWRTGLILSTTARYRPTLQADHRVSSTAVIEPDSNAEDGHTLIRLSPHPIAK